MSNDRQLDKFYTNEDIAAQCFNWLQKDLSRLKLKGVWLEPSAGAGVFYNLMQGEKIGIDLDPANKEIIKHDFLTYELKRCDYITLGNPPFGKNSSLAIKFFNKCAKHSKVVAFIVPRTFKKQSVQNKLDKFMTLFSEYEIPPNSFNFKNETVDVPCVFQVWVKTETPRKIFNEKITLKDISFVKRQEADIAFQRVGVKAGTIKGKDKFNDIADASHLFIKINNNKALDILNSINWDHIKYNTAGNPSISKNELIQEYFKFGS